MEITEEMKQNYPSLANLVNVIQAIMNNRKKYVAESFTENDMVEMDGLFSGEITYKNGIDYYELLIERLDLQPENYAKNGKSDLAKMYGQEINETLCLCRNCDKSFEIDKSMENTICCPECGSSKVVTGTDKKTASKKNKVNDNMEKQNNQIKEWLENIKRGSNA